jgi:hypothetical protein
MLLNLAIFPWEPHFLVSLEGKKMTENKEMQEKFDEFDKWRGF